MMVPGRVLVWPAPGCLFCGNGCFVDPCKYSVRLGV